MSKLLITRMGNGILLARQTEGRISGLELEDVEESILGNIYVGKVKNVIHNIGAAFVDIGNGQTAYYSLTENRKHHFAGERKRKAGDPLKSGDEIMVQVERDAVKTKECVVTSNLSFTGRYCVLTAGKNQISFSSKITDRVWKEEMRKAIAPFKEADFGVIVRTNAKNAEPEKILTELLFLKSAYCDMMETGKHRTCYSLLRKEYPFYIVRIRDTYYDQLEEIVTDLPEVYGQLKGYLEEKQPEDVGKLRLYQDKLLALPKLYSLEKAVEEALGKRVWLKSGGYLVIEPTEAMTVIDVNTGKYAGKKDLHDTIRKINLEAAKEISFQLRLRNLSGIILVDFIDMETAEDKEMLLETLERYCKEDSVKTTVVDMTRLGLVELTRKKIRRPFYEQMSRRR